MAILFVTASFSHIYMGTIAVEEGMWAAPSMPFGLNKHADLWYREKIREKEARSPG